MIWNYTNNRPLDSIRELSISPDSFQEEFDEWFKQESERNVYNEDDLQSVRSAIESVGYNLHDFMLTHAYNMIPNVKLREYYVVYMCLGTSPSSKFILYDTKEFEVLEGVDILYKAKDMRWGSQKNVSDIDIFCRYYFCESEEDIWDIFADGVGDLRKLSSYYFDQDKEKELKALQYIYNAENKVVKATTGKSYQTCPQSVKDEIVIILKEDYLYDADEEVKDSNNIQALLSASKNNFEFLKWIVWANKPNERREGRYNILPEIIDYLIEHPEEFDESSLLIEGRPHIIAATVSPRTWEAVSESFIDQCLENSFGKKYDSIASMPKEEIVHQIAGIIGNDAAEKFADYIIQTKKS